MQFVNYMTYVSFVILITKFTVKNYLIDLVRVPNSM